MSLYCLAKDRTGEIIMSMRAAGHDPYYNVMTRTVDCTRASRNGTKEVVCMSVSVDAVADAGFAPCIKQCTVRERTDLAPVGPAR